MLKRLSKTIAVLWLLFVLIAGIGGTWATHNPDKIFSVESTLTEEERQDIEQAKRDRERAEALSEAGWGSDAAPQTYAEEGWGN